MKFISRMSLMIMMGCFGITEVVFATQKHSSSKPDFALYACITFIIACFVLSKVFKHKRLERLEEEHEKMERERNAANYNNKDNAYRLNGDVDYFEHSLDNNVNDADDYSDTDNNDDDEKKYQY